MTKICLFVVVIVVSFNYFRSNLFYRGETVSNLSIFKKAKNFIGQYTFSHDGVHMLIPMDTYTPL